jgi:chromosome segregation ATPase
LVTTGAFSGLTTFLFNIIFMPQLKPIENGQTAMKDNLELQLTFAMDMQKKNNEGMEKSISGLKDDYKEMKSIANATGASITGMKQDYEEMTSSIGAMETSITGLKQDYEEMKSSIGAMETSIISNMTAIVRTLGDNVQLKNKSLERLQKSVQAMIDLCNQNLDVATQDLERQSHLEAQVNDLAVRLDRLEKQRSGWFSRNNNDSTRGR